MDFSRRYSQLVEKLPTRAFLAPLDEDEEIEVELARGVAASIKYKAMGELQANGQWMEAGNTWARIGITAQCTANAHISTPVLPPYPPPGKREVFFPPYLPSPSTPPPPPQASARCSSRPTACPGSSK